MHPDKPTTIHGFNVINTFIAAQLDGSHIGRLIHIEHRDSHDIQSTSLGILRSVNHTKGSVAVGIASHRQPKSAPTLSLTLETCDRITLLNH